MVRYCCFGWGDGGGDALRDEWDALGRDDELLRLAASGFSNESGAKRFDADAAAILVGFFLLAKFDCRYRRLLSSTEAHEIGFRFFLRILSFKCAQHLQLLAQTKLFLL